MSDPRFIVAARDAEDMELARLVEEYVNGPELKERLELMKELVGMKRRWRLTDGSY
jgi:hypothetical protein